MKGKVLSVLLLLTATVGAQPACLNEIRACVETRYNMYETKWICTGDTLTVDSSDIYEPYWQIDGYWMTCQEITQDLWQWFMHYNPSTDTGALLPVTNITRSEADSFCIQLSKATRQQWRVPTKEEWLFAYNGGIFSEGYQHSGSDNIKYVGWTKENSKGKLHLGGKLIPNELGIQDMDGNVAEMVTDGDSVLFAGRHFRQPVVKAKSPFIVKEQNCPPECRGMRIVGHKALWFNKYGERVYR